jgi:hypothetical protein
MDRRAVPAAAIPTIAAAKAASTPAGQVHRVAAALAAGAIAVALNMALLGAADWLDLPTAHGGLLRLLLAVAGDAGRMRPGPLFQAGFHVLVGLGMAVFYGLVLEPALRRAAAVAGGAGPLASRGVTARGGVIAWRRGLVDGFLYAAAVWIANAAVVLPLTGEGFAGSRHLSLAGMAWFAAAHTLFFIAVAVLFQRFNRVPRQSSRAG